MPERMSDMQGFLWLPSSGSLLFVENAEYTCVKTKDLHRYIRLICRTNREYKIDKNSILSVQMLFFFFKK